jgi:hypothetical protein
MVTKRPNYLFNYLLQYVFIQSEVSHKPFNTGIYIFRLAQATYFTSTKLPVFFPDIKGLQNAKATADVFNGSSALGLT